MIIKQPCIITPRLLPGLQIDDAFISIDIPGCTQGRLVYQVYIDLPDYTYDSTDLRSGVNNGDLQSGLSSLLSFLGAFAEARQYGNPESENWDLFPDELAEFCTQNSDEISMLSCDLKEIENLITE